MSATVLIYRWTGSGPSSTNVTSTNSRIDASDTQSTGETSAPVTIPASGTNYSFWASFRLYCSVAPATEVANLQIYSSGSLGLGTGWGLNVAQATTYAQGVGVTGNGTQLTTGNYATLTGSPVGFQTYTSGSTLALTGSIVAASAPASFGNYFVFQFTLGSTASPGPTSAQPTVTVQYDEW